MSINSVIFNFSSTIVMNNPSFVMVVLDMIINQCWSSSLFIYMFVDMILGFNMREEGHSSATACFAKLNQIEEDPETPSSRCIAKGEARN